jgi:hypothetical protein
MSGYRQSAMLFGFATISVLTLMTGTSSADQAKIGRYQMTAAMGTAFLLDTQTGQSWVLPAKDAVKWSPIYYPGTTPDELPMVVPPTIFVRPR